VYKGDEFLTKFLWGRLGGIVPRLCRGDDLPHGVGAYE